MTSLQRVEQQFPYKAPQAFLSKIDPSDPDDPLRRQVDLSIDETRSAPGYGVDPVGDQAASVLPGVIHKYHGRVLLIGTGACAIHCRYCFRRDFPYPNATASRDDWGKALDYIRGDNSLVEVILSGGDPLMLSARRLSSLVQGLESIDHVRRLRIHTRVPAADPPRVVRSSALDWLSSSRLQKVVVVHVNHANELGADTDAAFRALADAGATLLNQSVLLSGVNDDADALATLSERLFQAGTLPYYLHLLDKAAGTAHFHVTDENARHLMHQLRTRLSGFLVPRLVREQSAAPYKLPVL